MGQCCEDIRFQPNILEKAQARIYDSKINLQSYENAQGHHEEVHHALQHIAKKQQFKAIFENNKLMKHRIGEKYYLGQWNAQGFPMGLGVIYEPDHYLYHGEIDNLPNGKGTIQFIKEKLTYEGEFQEGSANGHGKITSKDKSIHFEGIMKKSYPLTGRLKIINEFQFAKSVTIQFKDFPEHASKVTYGDGRQYEGFINKKSLAPQGKGQAHFADNSQYSGNWEDGQMHGEGSFYWADGSSYHGHYQHGKKNGLGTFNFPSKKYYEGSWANGKQNGQGILYSKVGQILKNGKWHDNVFIQEDHI